MRKRTRWIGGLAAGGWIAALIILTLPLSLRAQDFGRNKVRYNTFDFQVLKAGPLDLYFYPEEREGALDAARMAERWVTRYEKVFNHKLSKRQPLILYADHPDFQQTNAVPDLISQGTGGVTEGMKDRVVLPLTGVYHDNDHVIGHELVHAFQYDVMNKLRGSQYQGDDIPLWMVEGMAEYFSIGRESPLTAMYLRDALVYKKLPTIKKVARDPEYFPYRWGQAIWAYIGSRWGDDKIMPIFRDVLNGNPEGAFRGVTKMSLDSLSADWQKAVRESYEPQLKGRTHPDSLGRAVITGGGGFNLSPSLSPDGRYLAFLSRRGLFSIDLFLADAVTGKLLGRLVSSNTDSHFDALRFIDAAGSWSPDGERLAIVVVQSGDNAIAILKVKSRKIERTFKLKGVQAISQIAWSPDGNTLAVAGAHGGISDLYLYDLKSRKTRQLTEDRYADIQPAWSPDGRTIAFVTDRGAGTDFDNLTYGPLKIGLYDMQSGDIRLIALENATKQIDPQYSPDGKQIYFVADPDGFSDIYRYDLETGKSFRLTRVATGVSGLTELSPALTVARNTGRMMFTVFQNTDYYIHSLDSTQTAGQLFQGATDMATNAALPPVGDGLKGAVEQYFDTPAQGLPKNDNFEVKDYKPRLSLAGAQNMGAGVGFGGVFGMTLSGGVSALYTDMLGNREVGLMGLVNGGIKDIGGQVSYMDSKHRFDWGVAAAHIPYLAIYPYYEVGTVPVNGQPVPAVRYGLIEQRVYQDWAPLLFDYPLSTNRRIEMSTGFTRYSYGMDIRSYLDVNGSITDEGKQSLPVPPAVNLSESSVAYVGDYSYFGYASPVNGRRYRLELGYTTGTLKFMSLYLDYRHYFFFNPLTLAFRGLHYGRYTGDSEDYRLYPLFIGDETLVRGYPIGSIENDPYVQTSSFTSYPLIDRLVGTRIAVLNAELRLPVLGSRQFGLFNFPWLPTEAVWFFDGGAAWTRGSRTVLKWATNSDQRVPVFSTGPAVRLSVSQYFAFQFYLAKPFQRPAKSWQWGFVLAPGW